MPLKPKSHRNFRNFKSKPLFGHYKSTSGFKLRKLHLTISGKNYATRLTNHYSRKFGQIVTPVALLKTLTVISSDFKHNEKLWILIVAPSRHLKSKTTREQWQIFPRNKLVYAGSDFTIHGRIRDYESGRKINRRCLLINDMTLLLGSKAEQTRSRLIDALSELASEGRYIYRDFRQSYEVEARFSLIANITPHSFRVNRRQLLGNTFTERCLIVHYALTDEEMSDANLNRERRDTMKVQRFAACICEEDVDVTRDDLVRFDDYAKRWRILGGYSSSSSLFDMIKSVAVAYAILSGHRKVTVAEYKYLDMLEPYLRDPEGGVRTTILELTHQGRSKKDICQILNKDPETYRPFVSRVLSEYRKKGTLS